VSTTNSVLTGFGLVLFGYLSGSVSPSVFLGKLFKGLDVRKHGSGNAGTTNAFRVLGPPLGIAVLVCDILKGVIPVLVARLVLGDEEDAPLVTVFVALACVAGHNYSILLRGRGGKGVATGAGAALAMMPIAMAFVIALFVILLLTTRIVSLASIIATVVFPVTAVVLDQPLEYLAVCCLISVVVLWAHRANFKRLWRRKEPRVVFPWNRRGPKAEDPGPAAS
jgi:glycerol-3-phosphate acyltransferase PlsY